MKVFIGADHAGYKLKEQLVPHLRDAGFEIEDLGPANFDKEDDYPDISRAVALSVAQNPCSKGIIIGKSGQGEAMCANRIEGIRAAVWYGGKREVLKLSREHNDANILSIGADFAEEALEDASLWLSTPFSEEERHVRRISKFR